MGMKKAGSTADRPAAVAEQPIQQEAPIADKQPESGATAAIERLSKPKAEAVQKPKYVPRDLESEAIGKTRCVMFAAALQSPALAGLRFNDAKEFLAIVQEAADAGVAYSFQK
jgi:hypothetical protein